MSAATAKETTNIVIAALGGEGGGTLSSWIEEVAHRCGWHAQTTSIAGVAQRTGATIYYIEVFPKDADLDRTPIMSMFPAPGDIDIAISSEIAEAGRLVQRGFCSKDRTTLISSSHHVYGITEKIVLGDGGIDPQEIAKVAAQQCKKLVSFDMREITEKHNTVISAALLGALAGSKALPFSKDTFVEVISQSEKMKDNNMAAFNASYNKAIAPVLMVESGAAPSAPEAPFVLPTATNNKGALLLSRIEKDFPASCYEFLTLGVSKLIDYQDYDYAHQYLDELLPILALDSEDYSLTKETARQLALWMSYEDTARVAQIKTRESRQTKIRAEVKAKDNQIIHVTEYFAPRLEELCQPLPAGLARTILRSPTWAKLTKPLTKGKRFRTDTIATYFLMRLMAFSRHWRRKSYTYAEEMERINKWLEQIRAYARNDMTTATEIARCAGIVKGYGKTRERGSQQIDRVLEKISADKIPATQIKALREAALSDDESLEFDLQLSA